MIYKPNEMTRRQVHYIKILPHNTKHSEISKFNNLFDGQEDVKSKVQRTIEIKDTHKLC